MLPGDIKGYVTDAETSEPISQATLKLTSKSDSTTSGEDGFYSLNNIEKGSYQIKVSKKSYAEVSNAVTVDEAEVTEMNFELTGIPDPEFSHAFLDFSLEKSEMYFTISNAGKGHFTYDISSGQPWISFEPDEGLVHTETDTIKVSINRSGLPDSKIMEEINILSYLGEEGTVLDNVGVYLNGVADQEGNYYGVVTIGTQIWMAESLNRGERISYTLSSETMDDGKVEKYCYDNLAANCDTFGGMYAWDEMMDYEPEQFEGIGTVQGVCPEGWHVPTVHEWHTLRDFLGGSGIAGGHLKATGTREEGTGLWFAPNEGATDAYGFTALPGGAPTNIPPYGLVDKGSIVQFWSAGEIYFVSMMHNTSGIFMNPDPAPNPPSYVRCVKDP